ncbi:Integrase, catalytic region, Zinc finger, CCHC-type, Peptidase aspartic, catalytic [Artemisia annua]|uniref:Integrase, catalytic region, Zinc finger, CCHC-type, Peptidase aspartic, catalytic n=1 Tax=Artemisia annua TaxID=35608 RepID=A0A2U1LKM9_ARTAN|nr:Integrase, catalytic region, Zinc finger, CCHC-type, Peptidase aspartic, catalytic [Artemisia annua]
MSMGTWLTRERWFLDSLAMAYYNVMYDHYDSYNPLRRERYDFIRKVLTNEIPEMPYHPMDHGEKVTESPHIQHVWKPRAPSDVHPNSRDTKMSFLMHEMRNHNMQEGTSERFQDTVVQGLLNHLQQFLPEKCHPQLLGTCDKPTLVQLYKLFSRAEEDFIVRKRKIEEVNDIQSFKRGNARLATVLNLKLHQERLATIVNLKLHQLIVILTILGWWLKVRVITVQKPDRTDQDRTGPKTENRKNHRPRPDRMWSVRSRSGPVRSVFGRSGPIRQDLASFFGFLVGPDRTGPRTELAKKLRSRTGPVRSGRFYRSIRSIRRSIEICLYIMVFKNLCTRSYLVLVPSLTKVPFGDTRPGILGCLSKYHQEERQAKEKLSNDLVAKESIVDKYLVEVSTSATSSNVLYVGNDAENNMSKDEQEDYEEMSTKKELNDDEDDDSSSESEDEEYAKVVKEFKRLIKKRQRTQDKRKTTRRKRVDDGDKRTKGECLVAQASNEICLRINLEPDEWVKDSGCSRHMTGNRKLFSTYKAYNGGNVIFGSNRRRKIIGKGTISQDSLTIENVEHVDNLTYNLLSVGQICDNNCRVTFTNKNSVIIKDDKVIGRGIRKGGVYVMKLGDKLEDRICLATLDENSTLWHRRLGYANMQSCSVLDQFKIQYKFACNFFLKMQNHNHTQLSLYIISTNFVHTIPRLDPTNF